MKEGGPAIYNNLDDTWGHYTKWNVRHGKKSTVLYHLYVEFYKRQKSKRNQSDDSQGLGMAEMWTYWLKIINF